jgi:hypothetical protein
MELLKTGMMEEWKDGRNLRKTNLYEITKSKTTVIIKPTAVIDSH